MSRAKREEGPQRLGGPVLEVIAGGGEAPADDTPMSWRCPRCGDLVVIAPDLAYWVRAMDRSLERGGKAKLGAFPCDSCREQEARDAAARKAREEAAERVRLAAIARARAARPPGGGEEI